MVKQQKLKTGWKVLEVPRKVPVHLVRSTIDDYLWDIDVTFENDGAVNSDGDPLLKVYLKNPTTHLDLEDNSRPHMRQMFLTKIDT